MQVSKEGTLPNAGFGKLEMTEYSYTHWYDKTKFDESWAGTNDGMEQSIHLKHWSVL